MAFDYVGHGGQISWMLDARAATFTRTEFAADEYTVAAIDKRLASELVVRHHYLHRAPNQSYAFGLFAGGDVVGAVTFGAPASRHLQMGACPESPSLVTELNRLWCHDDCPRNTESYFVSRALRMLPPLIVVSYADTKWGHVGTVYRALGFRYAGWTDMERKVARWDYIPQDGKHTRDSWRTGEAAWTHRVRRKPKAKYWRATGDRRDRRRLERMCGWPSLDWREFPVPFEHRQFKL